jgi:ribosomal-protein-alanine N-acetyltransferase
MRFSQATKTARTVSSKRFAEPKHGMWRAHAIIRRMTLELPVLGGRTLRLEPLHVDHAAGLARDTTPDEFQYAYLRPAAMTLQAFETYIEQRQHHVAGWHTYTMVLQENDQPVGMSAYMDVRLSNRGLEIGGTWISKPYQGTHVNPVAKYLMLQHAFETLGMLRVQLKCDARNEQSQRALAKLGAVREGVLRKHMVLPDGYVRDSVMFSITDDEWPGVKQGLEARLGTSHDHA